MLRKTGTVALLWIMLASPAYAGLFGPSGPGADEIQKALTAPEINIENYEMPKDELTAFYAAREFKPAWNFAGSDNIAALNAFLESTGTIIAFHGLVKNEYPLDPVRKLAAVENSDKVKLEFLVTYTLLRLAHDLHGDDIDLDDLYPGWVFRRVKIDIPASLATAVADNNLNDFIEGLAPKIPAYRELAAALKTYRDIAATDGWPKINSGPTIRPGDKGPRIEQLRARLGMEGYLPPMSLPQDQGQVYDADLQKTVEAYQLRNGLDADGNIGKITLDTLNVPVETRILQIRANMERWRHMPDDFPPENHVIVNIANQTVDIAKDGKPLYRGPVVIGRVDRKTPFIQSAIRSMIINPSWHVPAKIAQKDILPKLRKDPHYLEKLGFVISGSEDDPHGENIDWSTMPAREFNFRLRQSPGDMNSLGRLKFDFDNDFAVYMHGTPHQELFAKTARTFSSGCIRLRDPVQIAEIIMSDNAENWNAQKVEEAIAADKTRWVPVAKPLPIFVAYWTVFQDEEGHINFRNDAYNYDRFLMEHLENDGEASRAQSAQ